MLEYLLKSHDHVIRMSVCGYIVTCCLLMRTFTYACELRVNALLKVNVPLMVSAVQVFEAVLFHMNKVVLFYIYKIINTVWCIKVNK